MDAQAVKTIGGIAEVGGVVWLVTDLIVQSRYAGHLAKGKARLRSSWNWVRQHVLRRRREHNLVIASATMAISSGAVGSLTVSRELPVALPGATVEERLAAIEQWAESLRRQFADERQDREQARRQDQEAVQRELETATQQLAARITAVKELVAQLEDATVGGVSLRWSSIPVLLAGIACTTWPDGIAERIVPHWLTPMLFWALVALVLAAILVGKTLTALYRA